MKTTTNHVRIIGGKWRSRKLAFPDAEGLRPTPDRIRETLFNWLQNYVVAEDCLDLFAGSGACGIEALSRQAGQVTFVDSSRAALQALRENLRRLDAIDATLLCEDALHWLKSRPSGRFGIVFMDPPFDDELLESACTLLEDSGVLKTQALIYLESGRPLTQLRLPHNWLLLKSSRGGAVHYGLCQRLDSALPGSDEQGAQPD